MIARERVEIENRRAMTPARKARIHAMRDGKCWMCGKPVAVSGPDVIYDHKMPLELGGTDDNSNVWPLHRTPCDKLKTAADRKRIDKAKRLDRKFSNPLPTGCFPSRPFPKSTRKLEGRGFDKRRKVNA